MPPTIISGVRARADLLPNREATEFERGIFLLDPNENPFTLIVSELKRKTSGTIDYHWFRDVLLPETAALTAQVDHYQVTSIPVDDAKKFVPGDLIMFLDETKTLKGREVALVTGITGNNLDVTRDYANRQSYSQTPAVDEGRMASGSLVLRVGSIYEQGHPLPNIATTQVVEVINYCADIRTALGMTEVAVAAAYRGDDDWAYQMRKKGIEHARKVEYMNLFGQANAGDKGLYDSTTGNTNPTSADGIEPQIASETAAVSSFGTGSLTMNAFLDTLERAFRYGPRTKYLFCPPKLRTAFDQWGLSKLNTFTSDRIFGRPVDVWQSSHGELIIVTHKMLDVVNPANTGSQEYYAFILDVDDISWVTYSNIGATRLRPLDPYRATGETVRKVEYQTIGCVAVGQPLHHHIIKFVDYTAA